MSTVPLSALLFMAGAFVAGSLVTWAWLVMDSVEADLKTFTGFEGLHLDV